MGLRCDVVAVGTELLLGQIVDTNSSWIGEQLALSGIDSLHQTKVGDNLERLVDELRLAVSLADAVIVCGGLGPTHDDLTRDALAALMGVELRFDPEIGEAIRQMFASRGRSMPENNLRQAMVPIGATVIPNPRGTAPGLMCPIGESGKVVYAVPGVPYEMRGMLSEQVLPDLRRRAGDMGTIRSRTVRTWGDSESGLNEKLDDVIARLDEAGNPTLAFLASGWEGIKVRLTAKAKDAATADAVLDRWEAEVRQVCGTTVFGVDDDTMESVVNALLLERGLTIGLAESVTGGLVSARLTDAPGASETVRGAVVSYASEVKFDLLGVRPGPVVTAAAAEQMAIGARRVLGSDVGLALTGVAGPAEQEGQPVGTLFVGLALGDNVESRHLRLPGDREQMRQFSVISSLDLVRQRLLGHPGADVLVGLTALARLARLFVAAWPPSTVVEQLADLPRPERAGVRWTGRDSWHVTLRFFGAADPDAASSALAGTDAPVADAVLGPVTRRLGRAVLVVPVAGLDGVAEAVTACTAHIGTPPEHRRFSGHLTLARMAPAATRDRAAIADLVGAAVAARFRVSEVTLVASHLGRGPARYEVLERFALGRDVVGSA